LVFHRFLRLAKSQAHCATNLALFKIRTDLFRPKFVIGIPSPLPQSVAGEYLHAFFASNYVYVSFQEFIIAAVAVIT
jgi:hypothetical protein